VKVVSTEKVIGGASIANVYLRDRLAQRTALLYSTLVCLFKELFKSHFNVGFGLTENFITLTHIQSYDVFLFYMVNRIRLREDLIAVH